MPIAISASAMIFATLALAMNKGRVRQEVEEEYGKKTDDGGSSVREVERLQPQPPREVLLAANSCWDHPLQ